MEKLYILWTNDNIITSEKMVFMYGANSLIHKWWDEVTIIVWGATSKLAAENDLIKLKIKYAKSVGVKLIACKACADQLGTTKDLLSQGIDVKYFGEGLTEIIKGNEKLITI